MPKEKTWFKLYRGWQEHPMFRSDKDKLNWLWLIENAVIHEKTISIKSNPITLKRGQISYSIRYLAKAWGCSRGYVESFIKHLKKWDSIRTENRTGQIVITICNYCDYQDKQDDIRTAYGEKTRQGQDNVKTNTKNDKECIKNKEYILRPSDVSQNVWDDFLNLRKKKKAVVSEKVIENIRKQGEKISWPLEQCLEQMVMRNWQGFNHAWIKGESDNEGTGRSYKQDDKSDRAKAAIMRGIN